MDTALVVITVLSVGLTCALLVYAARLQREQRERAEARVAALARAIHEEEVPFARVSLSTLATPADQRASIEDASAPAASPDALAAFAEAPLLRARAGGTEEATGSLPSERDAPSPIAATLFEDRAEAPQRTPSTIILVFGGIALVGCLFGGAYAWTRPAPAALPAAATPAATPSIELLSLEQVRKGTTLVVSGTVRNPDGAPARKGLSAMVFLFDGSGQVVASARAPLDIQLLPAGDESPFVVSVPDATRAVRLRLGFRGSSGVVTHVDGRK
jgi:hypothetical protein